MKRSLKTAAVCELTVHLHLRNKALLGHHSKSKSRNEETEARKRESGREREYKTPRRDNKDPISDGNFDEGDEKPTKKEQQG